MEDILEKYSLLHSELSDAKDTIKRQKQQVGANDTLLRGYSIKITMQAKQIAELQNKLDSIEPAKTNNNKLREEVERLKALNEGLQGDVRKLKREKASIQLEQQKKELHEKLNNNTSFHKS